MRNIRLTIQYDGTRYHGWQIQQNAVTVQQVMEEAVFRVTGSHARITGCGRTDAGVHALAYTANFFTDCPIPADRIPYALNTKLPADIRCLCAREETADFHAKNSARRKHYRYQINHEPFPNVFLRDYAWHYANPLDIAAMRASASVFVGTHDFAGFASSGMSAKTTVRTIYSLDVCEKNGLITVDAVGNGFLYNMVRIITGTLVFAGAGKIKPEDMQEILLSKDRTRAGVTAPPQGLFLTEVYY